VVDYHWSHNTDGTAAVVQEQMESVVSVNSYADGGIRHVAWSLDGKHVVVTGADASLTSFRLRYTAQSTQITSLAAFSLLSASS